MVVVGFCRWGGVLRWLLLLLLLLLPQLMLILLLLLMLLLPTALHPVATMLKIKPTLQHVLQGELKI